MKNYELLYELGCFTRKELTNKVGGNLRTADSIIYSYQKKNLLLQVKQNLYVVKSIATNQSALNIFEIASHITPTAYISNHSAFEYYGMQNQVYNEVYVASDTFFRPVVFEGKVIKYVKSYYREGVELIGRHIKVTDLERTVIDSIKNLSTIGGLEELVKELQMINSLDFSKMKKYLEKYDNVFLYQKTGFFMELLKEQYYTPEDFTEFCLKKISKSVRKLDNEKNTTELVYNKKWHLYVPENLEEEFLDV